MQEQIYSESENSNLNPHSNMSCQITNMSNDKYNEKGHNNIDFWDGNGFKIEKTSINDVIVILITNASVTPKSSQTFNIIGPCWVGRLQ